MEAKEVRDGRYEGAMKNYGANRGRRRRKGEKKRGEGGIEGDRERGGMRRTYLKTLC